jgi:hypothetical protein
VSAVSQSVHWAGAPVHAEPSRMSSTTPPSPGEQAGASGNRAQRPTLER